MMDPFETWKGELVPIKFLFLPTMLKTPFVEHAKAYAGPDSKKASSHLSIPSWSSNTMHLHLPIMSLVPLQ
jgi:hypothetical protein